MQRNELKVEGGGGGGGAEQRMNAEWARGPGDSPPPKKKYSRFYNT